MALNLKYNTDGFPTIDELEVYKTLIQTTIKDLVTSLNPDMDNEELGQLVGIESNKVIRASMDVLSQMLDGTKNMTQDIERQVARYNENNERYTH